MKGRSPDKNMGETANKKPRLLYVISVIPCPPEMGVHHRILNIGLQLKRYADISVVYIGRSCEENRIRETEQKFGPIRILPVREKNESGMPAALLHKIKFHWPWFHADPISPPDRERFFQLWAGFILEA